MDSSLSGQVDALRAQVVAASASVAFARRAVSSAVAPLGAAKDVVTATSDELHLLRQALKAESQALNAYLHQLEVLSKQAIQRTRRAGSPASSKQSHPNLMVCDLGEGTSCTPLAVGAPATERAAEQRAALKAAKPSA